MQSLVEAALVGTARQPDRARSALEGDQPVDEVVTALDESVALERRVLLAAAAHDLYARAGRMPRTDVEAVRAASAETRPSCPASVATLLGELLVMRPRTLLAEALRRLDAAGMIVPPSLLPDLFDLRDPSVGALLSRVIGERGRWLLSLVDDDADWLRHDALDPAEALRVWEEGSLPRRLAVLRARRLAEPEVARAWLAASWATESAEHRTQLLAVIGESLEPADAPFLESALADRSANVRAVAARLLARLPSSEAALRFAERADAMLDYDAPSAPGIHAKVQKAVGLARAGTLHVRPPERWDAAWERDGITAKPQKGTGERAHWLTEALALVAPEHWSQRFGTDARTLIRAALESEWATTVLHGWSRGAIAVKDHVWAAALWDAWLDDVKSGEATARHESTTRATVLIALYRALSAADAEARTLALMHRPATDRPFGLSMLVDAVAAPWTAEYSRRFLDEIASPLAVAVGAQWAPGTWLEVLEAVAMRLAPTSFAAALALAHRLATIENAPPSHLRELEGFAALVRLRQRIHEEIPGEPARR